ncbi:GH32 C-terminal domain-containing protein [Luteococcus japonicus]|uniref:Sucrose-6-phosphate hydrolase n=1 Tax=Luteococcus japonicus LSP_Lj1 TaxID=1255658 RepID=A0A1R4ITC9_9ACTN|nr:GH32 C-terminal domain-containing protein [Luteococcus japonicus]SJN22815.1 Sucrose-6-phosphate hydrolase [Luteococcus japonicus LSP_Lj1]
MRSPWRNQPAQSGIQRAQWLDHGADHYAAVTAGATPTSPWRSNFTVPRELTLAKDKGRYVVSSAPVKEFTGLTGRKLSMPSRLTVDGNKALAGRGKQLDIRMRLDLGQASTAEMDVHVGNGQYTRIGVDRSTSELFIDRRQSGRTALNPDFAAVHRAPIALRGKKVELRIMVDHNSVEVFADGGRIAMTDLVFPDRTSDGLALFSEGGRSSVRNLEVRAVDSIWKRS